MGAFEGIETEKINTELTTFVEQTAPNYSTGAMFKPPVCGETRAIELRERVRPILDKLFPEWESVCSGSSYEAFSDTREACMRLLAQIASRSEIDAMLAGHDASPQLSAAQLHGHVWTAASAQWQTGHRHEAVLAASKAVNSMLQAKVKRRDLSDTKLVQEAFSEKDPQLKKPRLRFPDIDDEQTRDSMRMGHSASGLAAFKRSATLLGTSPTRRTS